MIRKIFKGIGILFAIMVVLGIITSFLGDDSSKKENGKAVIAYMNELKNRSDLVDKTLSEYEKQTKWANNYSERAKIENDITPILTPELQKLVEVKMPQLQGDDQEKQKTIKLLKKASTELYFAQEARRVAIVHIDDGQAIQYMKKSEKDMDCSR